MSGMIHPPAASGVDPSRFTYRALPTKYCERPFMGEYYPSDMAITIDSLDHIVLTVASIDISIDFYTEVLGMEVSIVDGRKALAFGEQMIKLQQRGHEVNPKAAHPTSGAGDICFITST